MFTGNVFTNVLLISAIGIMVILIVNFTIKQIKANKVNDKMIMLKKCLSVCNRQLFDYKSKDARLMDDIKVHQDSSLQDKFLSKLNDNLFKEKMILADIKTIITEMAGLRPGGLSKEFSSYHIEVKRMESFKRFVDRTLKNRTLRPMPVLDISTIPKHKVA